MSLYGVKLGTTHQNERPLWLASCGCGVLTPTTEMNAGRGAECGACRREREDNPLHHLGPFRPTAGRLDRQGRLFIAMLAVVVAGWLVARVAAAPERPPLSTSGESW